MNMRKLALATALTLAACGGSPPNSGGTGAFGVVTVNGKQKLYLPLLAPNSAGNGQVAVIDVGQEGKGVTGVNGLITNIDLGTTDYATATGGDEKVIVAVSTQSPTIWLIDPTTDKLTKTLSLPDGAGRSSFSGGGGYVTGVAMDSANHRAILSVWNGFAILDTDSASFTATIQAPPSENFGFDSVHQRIIAPFYECADSMDPNGTPPAFCGDFTTTDGIVMSDGLNVIDLSDNTVYTYQDPSADDPTQPVGSEPDSAAADPNNQLVVVPSEGGGFQNVIDLSAAKFDKSSRSFTATNHRLDGLGQTGVAIEASRHYGFLEEEWDSEIGVFSLEDATSGKTTGVSGDVPDLPDGTVWSNMGDPHGVAVSTALTNGASVGFVVNGDQTWVARIDLEKFAALPQTDGMVGDLSSAVTFINARQ